MKHLTKLEGIENEDNLITFFKLYLFFMSQTTVERIIERYNDSVSSINEAYFQASNCRLNEAMNSINSSASAIYQSLEWFLKKYLNDKFPGSSTFPKEHKIIEGNSFHDKVDLFEKAATPSIRDFNINIDTIKALKQSVRNDPEHSGVVPHFNSLKIVIRESYKIISNYLVTTIPINELNDSLELVVPDESNWSDFFGEMDSFESERNYILVADANLKPFANTLKPLGLIDWRLIVDFDSSSFENGLNFVIGPEIKSRRTIHQYTLNDQVAEFNSRGAIHWLYANGMKDRNKTSFAAYKEWNRYYSAYLAKVFSKYQLNVSDSPTTILFLTESIQYVQELSRLFYNSLGDSVKFVFAGLSAQHSDGVLEIYDGVRVDISISQIANGILRFRSYFNSTTNDDSIAIPHKDNGYIEISKDDYLWIEEDLSLLYRNMINNEIATYGIDKKIKFYKGGEIDWCSLHFNIDIRRDIYTDLKTKVERKVRERVPSRFDLYHYPGVGGTTLSRRLAWDMHNNYPIALLKNYRKVDTINRIYKLYQLSALPPLIIIDSANIDETEFDYLYSELLQRNFPGLLINVQRQSRFKNQSKDSIFLSEILSDVETASFVSVFSELAPEKKDLLKEIIESNDTQKKHPFYFGLVAFEENFQNLQTFVKRAIDSASPIEKKILEFISFVDIYAQRSLSAQLFTGILMFPESTVVRLEQVLGTDRTYLLSNRNHLNWTALHYLIAKQILFEVYGAEGNEALLKNGIASLALEFIDLVGNKTSFLTEDELDIFNQLFISRNFENEEEPGSEENHFSKLISDGLPDDISRVQVFEKLTDTFPEYSHFWSHLARFYSFKIRNPEKALAAIEKAIQLDEAFESNDSTLYHIKGMILRSKLRRITSRYVPNSESIDEIRSQIRLLFEDSSAAFLRARELNPKDEYGYISDIELIISYLDFKFIISSFSERAVFLSNLNVYDLQALERAQELLDEVKTLYIGHDESFYVRRCEGLINEYYTNYNSIIQNWYNLLDNARGYPKETVRRHLVRAYIGRADGWENLNVRDAEKVLRLVEDNISENPNNPQNIILWFRTARVIETITINEAIEKVSRWRLLRPTLESSYYLTCLHVLLAIKGDSLSKTKAEVLLRETSEMSRFNTNRSYCQNWLGKGNNIASLVSSKDAINRERSAGVEIIFNVDNLDKINARIVEIKGPEAGILELECGLKVFFIPARSFKGEGAVRDKHLNELVKFYLGFSYDGLRGFDVELVA